MAFKYAPMARTRAAWAPVVVVLLYAFAFLALFPPLPGSTDTYVYKDAGANLALGRGMTSAMNFGSPETVPQLYAGYVPGQALIYGAFAAVAGVSPEANTVFDLLVICAVSLLAHNLLGRGLWPGPAGPKLQIAAVVLLLAMLLVRYVELAIDRPDGLGLLLALASLYPPLHSRQGVLASALLCGLALVTSPLCGVLAMTGVTLRWLLQPRGQRLAFPVMFLLGLAAFLPAIVALLVLLSLDSTYLARFLGYSETGLTAVSGEDIGLWWDFFWTHGYTTPHHWMRSLLLLVSFVGCLALLSRVRRESRSPIALAMCLVGLAAIFSLAIVPWNKHYGALAAGFLLPACVAAIPRETWDRTSRSILLGAVAALVALQFPFAAKSVVGLATMRESYARMSSAVLTLPLVDRNGDGEIIILPNPFGYFLFKPLPVSVANEVDYWLERPELRVSADYFAFSYVGSGDPLVPRRPDWWPAVAQDMELLYRPTLPQQPVIFGHILTTSSQTWELEIWGRR